MELSGVSALLCHDHSDIDSWRERSGKSSKSFVTCYAAVCTHVDACTVVSDISVPREDSLAV